MAIGTFLGGLAGGLQQGVGLAGQLDEQALRRKQAEQESQNAVDLGMVDPRLKGKMAPAASVLPWFQAKAQAGLQGNGPPAGMKLRPGEFWNAQNQRVEAAPGSDLYIKQQDALGKDVGAVDEAGNLENMGVSTIDALLDNKEGFESQFGGYNALVSKWMPTDAAAKARANLETLKSNLKLAGKKMMAQGGAIGQMTEREWPIVENVLASISPTLGEEDAKAALEEVRARLKRINSLAKDKFSEQWQGTQYMDRPSNRSRAGLDASDDFSHLWK